VHHYSIHDYTGRNIVAGMLAPGTNNIQLQAQPGMYLIKFGYGQVRKLVVK